LPVFWIVHGQQFEGVSVDYQKSSMIPLLSKAFRGLFSSIAFLELFSLYFIRHRPPTKTASDITEHFG